jgi:aminoglycoside/choline kinase family phosphotransferase
MAACPTDEKPIMQRQQQLTEWLHSLFPGQSFTLAPASADASFRRYFRATFSDGSTRIVMDAPPQHEDCRPFLHIGKLFEEAGAHVPHVFAQDLEQGFLLLSERTRAIRSRDRCADQNPAGLARRRIAAL